MSIIHDALNKLQQKQQVQPDQEVDTNETIVSVFEPLQAPIITPAKKNRHIHPYLLIVAGVFFLSGVYLLLPMNHKKSSSIHTLPASPLSHKSSNSNRFLSKLKLNGVIATGNNKEAIINHRAYRVGDLVDGMTILLISTNSVILSKNQSTYTLRVL